eukprot:gnl/TRDRNA2_/TRDRNA2_143189_c0_seq2.p1 gnl/TRDRNA2_/TRDRNA2_143189_c0~~gnl/TRDRNA2_/TRDRNA2_143189_c0_seq2.p1  ORF type:complete len:856 (+),score=119.15 gnl/TRDRNA2_/TRDRNA2_143189_c0_seq2:3-2570(+)
MSDAKVAPLDENDAHGEDTPVSPVSPFGESLSRACGDLFGMPQAPVIEPDDLPTKPQVPIEKYYTSPDEMGEHSAYEFLITTPKISGDYMLELKKLVEDAGFYTDLFESLVLTGDQAVLHLRLALPRERMLEFADAIGAPARMDPQKLRDACARLSPPIKFDQRPVGGSGIEVLTRSRKYYPPFLHIFVPYRDDKKELFMNYRPCHRHKLICRLLSSPEKLPPLDDGTPCKAKGAGLNLLEMDQCTPFEEYEMDEETGRGPRIATLTLMHRSLDDDRFLRGQLYKEFVKGGCKTLNPWQIPVNQIREYFGEQVGFYFLLLSTFAQHCVPMGLVGLVVNAVIWAVGVHDQTVERQLPACLFAPVSLLAMFCFLIHFQRKQSTAAKEWGCYAWAHSSQVARKQFKGQAQTDPVDGHILVDWDSRKRLPRKILSQLVICGLMLVSTAVISAIFWLQMWSRSLRVQCDEDAEGAQCSDREVFLSKHGVSIGTALNVGQVQLLNIVFGSVANRLTLYENWKTDLEFSNSLISKLFIFKFFNTFASLTYVAFFKQFEKDGCNSSKGGCLEELAGLLRPLFLTNAGISFVLQVLIPFMKKWRIMRKIKGNDNVTHSDEGRQMAQSQYLSLCDYDQIRDTIDDYMEVAIQFGYVTLYGAAFPVSYIFVLLTTLFQIKQDAFKLLVIHYRIAPMDVCGIGQWERVFQLILYLGVWTNMGFIVFTTQLFNFDDAITEPIFGRKMSVEAVKIWIFFIGALCFYGVLKSLPTLYPANSPAVKLQLKRQEIYGDRVVSDLHVEEAFDEAEGEDDPSAGNLLKAAHQDPEDDVDTEAALSTLSQRLSCKTMPISGVNRASGALQVMVGG